MESSESSGSDMDWTNEEDGLAAQPETSMTEEGGRRGRPRGRGRGEGGAGGEGGE